MLQTQNFYSETLKAIADNLHNFLEEHQTAKDLEFKADCFHAWAVDGACGRTEQCDFEYEIVMNSLSALFRALSILKDDEEHKGILDFIIDTDDKLMVSRIAFKAMKKVGELLKRRQEVDKKMEGLHRCTSEDLE